MHSPPRILLVEDELVQRMLLHHRLDEAGYDLEVARDGHEALELALQSRPDLVLLDCVMPGLDGFEVLRRLRADPTFQAIPILMLTTLQEAAHKVQALELGADEFLVKPVDQPELLARVRSLLRLRELREALELRNSLMRRILNRYLAEGFVERLLADPREENLQLGGRLCRVSVLFADLRGFTSFSDGRPPEAVAHALNTVFDDLVPLIFENHGTFDKYLGDAVLAFFGAPTAWPDDPLRAVRTALGMQQAFRRLRAEHPGLRDLGLGVSVATGEAVVGNLGSQQVMDYTVIGDTPNVARRLQELCADGQILVDPTTCREVARHVEVRERPPVRLKGKKEPMPIFEVVKLE